MANIDTAHLIYRIVLLAMLAGWLVFSSIAAIKLFRFG